MPGPILTIGVNDAGHAKVAPGWPVELRATLLNPMSSPPLHANRLAIEVRASSGELVEWKWRPGAVVSPFHAAAKPIGIWLTDPEFTATLDMGCYDVTARLAGTALEARGRLEVTTSPVLRPSEYSREELRWFIRYHRARGQATLALARIEAWLRNHPGDYRALTWKAEVLEESGRVLDAIRVWSEAADAASPPSRPFITAAMPRASLSAQTCGLR